MARRPPSTMTIQPTMGPGPDICPPGALSVGGIVGRGAGVSRRAGWCSTGVAVGRAAGVPIGVAEGLADGLAVGAGAGGISAGAGVGTGATAQVGLMIVSSSNVTVPLRASARPKRVTRLFIVIEVRARMVPTKFESEPSVAELETCQKTLHG